MTAPLPLFVYGTLRRGSGAPMQAWLARRARYIDRGRLNARLHDVGAWPAAVDGAPGDRVIGDLCLPVDPHTLLRLDAWEGCAGVRPAYVRAVRPVQRDDGSTCDAWVYLYARDVSGLAPIPSGDYLSFRAGH